MWGVLPSRPVTIGRIPAGPGGLGLGALGAETDATVADPRIDGRRVDACWDKAGRADCSQDGKKKVADAFCAHTGAGTAVAYGDKWREKTGTIYLPTMRKCGGCSSTLTNVQCAGSAPAPATPASSVPPPPGAVTAPPTPLQVCNAPASVTLGVAERWVEVDPVQCLWQIVRTTSPGEPQVLPHVYGGTATIEIPQSAPPGVTSLSPGAVGLYQPSWQLPGAGAAGGLEVSSAEILQAFVDVLGRGPTPEELTAAQGQHLTNVAELYTYIRELEETDTGGGGGGVGLGDGFGWFAEHPYLSLGLGAVGLWFLVGGRRR